MSLSAQDVKFRIIGEDAASQAFRKVGGSMRDVIREQDRIKLGFASVGQIAAASIAGISMASVVGYLHESVTMAREAGKAQSNLESVLKATGNAAGYTAKQLSSYADELRQSTNFDDDDIVQFMATLATFRNVSGDTFKSTTKLALDMSTVLGTDLQTAAISLGKALNNPIEGIASLRRTGITFNDQQKAQIKTMQEHGDIVGAQGIVLKELSQEFGGAAEAAVGADGGIQQLTVSYGNFREKLGQSIIDIMNNTGAIDDMKQAVEGMTNYLDDNEGVLVSYFGTLKDIAGAAKWAFEEMSSLPKIFNDPVFGTVASLFPGSGGLMEVVKMNQSNATIYDLEKKAYEEAEPGKGRSNLLSTLDEIKRKNYRPDTTKSSGSGHKSSIDRFAADLENAEKWFRKYNNTVEGLAAAEEEHITAIKNLNILYKGGKIDFEGLQESTRDADIELDQVARSLMDSELSKGATAIWEQLFGFDVTEAGRPLSDKDAQGNLIKGIDGFSEASETIQDTFSRIGDSLSQGGQALGGRIGGGLGVIGSGFNILGADTSEMTDAQKSNNDLQGYLSIASGLGQMAGGSVGSAVSSVASMAAAGATVGGPIGAVVGGVVGLVSEIFGGSSTYKDEKANRDNMRRDLYDNMVSSALSGGTESRKLLSASGWNYDVLKNMSDPYPGSGGRLFEDRGVTRLQLLNEVMSVLDSAGATIEEFAKPSTIRELESARTQYDYAIAKVGALASVTTAYWDSLISTMTGINADSISEMFGTSIENSDSAASAAELFAETFEDQIIKSIKEMAISQAVNDAIMPYLSSTMTAIVQGMMAGSDITGLVDQAKTIASQIAPTVGSLYSIFDAAGIMDKDVASASSSIMSASYAINPLMLERRAKGGPVSAGESYIVGDGGRPELFTPDADGFITPYLPDGSGGSMDLFLAKMERLLGQGQEVTVTIDGQQFTAWMEKNRVKSETRIANGMGRTTTQVF